MVSKGRTADGEHELKVTTEGEIIRCSNCNKLSKEYSQELAKDPALQAELDKVKAETADPSKQQEMATALESKLKDARVENRLTKLETIDPSARANYDDIVKAANGDPATLESIRTALCENNVSNKEFVDILQKTSEFMQKHGDRVSGDFMERFKRAFSAKGDGNQAKAEIDLAIDMLDGKSPLGPAQKVQGLTDKNGSQQNPDYRVTDGTGNDRIVESKAITGDPKNPGLNTNNIQGNLKKALSQVKEQSSRTGETDGYVRLDGRPAGNGSVTVDEVTDAVRGQIKSSLAPNQTQVKWVEVIYKDATGVEHRIVYQISGNVINIAPQ